MSVQLEPKVACVGCLEPVDEVDDEGQCPDCAYEEAAAACEECGNVDVSYGRVCVECLELLDP